MVGLPWPPAVAVLNLGSRLDWFAVLLDRDAPRAVSACELFLQLRSKKERGADAMCMRTFCTTPWDATNAYGNAAGSQHASQGILQLRFLPSLSRVLHARQAATCTSILLNVVVGRAAIPLDTYVYPKAALTAAFGSRSRLSAAQVWPGSLEV